MKLYPYYSNLITNCLFCNRFYA